MHTQNHEVKLCLALYDFIVLYEAQSTLTSVKWLIYKGDLLKTLLFHLRYWPQWST
jgi:hypothetical protein